jgi:dihydrofolate reductase
MRKVVFQMMSTLNGRIDDPDAWVTGVGEDLYTEIDRLYDTFDTILVGRVTYDEMYAYWPGAADEDGATETNKRMARRMNDYRKLVLSRTGEAGPLAWNNAEQVVIPDDDEMVAFIDGLKRQPGGDIHLSGGARLAQSIVRLGLVDDYHVFVYPVISAGESWFGQVPGQRGIELVNATTFENGVIGLHLRPGDGSPISRPDSFTELLS